MKITSFVSTGIILSLLGSNFIIGKQYISDNYKNESSIKKQKETIEQYIIKTDVQNKQLKSNMDEIKVLSGNINDLHEQLDVLSKQLKQVKQEKAKVEKQLASRGEVKKQRKFYVSATAYTAMCNEGCTGITYTEHDVRNTTNYKGMKIIASDNSVIPLYSIVRVDTKNESFNAIVLDRGGGINGFEIDLLVRTESEAVKFGRQKVMITVIKEGKG